MAWIWIEDENLGDAWRWDHRDGPQPVDQRPIEMMAFRPSANGERVENDGTLLAPRRTSTVGDVQRQLR